MKNILILAVAIGCSMMSKLSGGMIALFTGPVFLAVLVICIRQRKTGTALPRAITADGQKTADDENGADEEDRADNKHSAEDGKSTGRFPQFSQLTIKKLLVQFAAFLAVCAPLGLWHTIRNLAVLGQPLGYVPSPPLDSDLYVGWFSLRERFFSFPLSRYFGSWCNPREDYNVWAYLLKCALFGEWEFNVPRLLADSFLLLFLILTLLSVGCMFYSLRKKNAHPILRCGLLLLTAVQLLMYVNFNIGYPFGCTMDFRYVVPLVLPFAVFTALAADWADQGGKQWRKGVSAAVYTVIGGFCALSVLIYVIL